MSKFLALEKMNTSCLYTDGLHLRHDLHNSTTGPWKNSGKTKLFCRDTLTFLFFFNLINNVYDFLKTKQTSCTQRI